MYQNHKHKCTSKNLVIVAEGKTNKQKKNLHLPVLEHLFFTFNFPVFLYVNKRLNKGLGWIYSVKSESAELALVEPLSLSPGD